MPLPVRTLPDPDEIDVEFEEDYELVYGYDASMPLLNWVRFCGWVEGLSGGRDSRGISDLESGCAE